MAHGTLLNVGAGGNTLATYDLATGGAWPTSSGHVSPGALFVCASTSTAPALVTAANPLYVHGGVASGATDAGNPVKIGGVYNSAAPTLLTGQRGDAQLDASGNLKVNVAGGLGQTVMANSVPVTIASNQTNLPANVAQVGGSALALGQTTMAASVPVTIASNQAAVPASQNGTWTVQPGNTANTTPWLVAPQPATTGAATPYQLISAATTNATSVKATPGTVYAVQLSNSNAAARFVKLYDKASAPTVGTDTPVQTYLVPPTTGNVTITLPVGMKFAAGIALAVTGAVTVADTTAVGLNDVVVNLVYA